MQESGMKQVRSKWGVAVLIAIAAVLTLAGNASPAQRESASGMLLTPVAAADAAQQVIIDNYKFSPPQLTVKVGTTVTWINHDDDPHSVDSAQGKFKSSTLNTDDKFEFRFTEAGEYPFFCRFHPKMIGKIIAQP